MREKLDIISIWCRFVYVYFNRINMKKNAGLTYVTSTRLSLSRFFLGMFFSDSSRFLRRRRLNLGPTESCFCCY